MNYMDNIHRWFTTTKESQKFYGTEAGLSLTTRMNLGFAIIGSLFMFFFVLFTYGDIPATVPTRMDFEGNITGYGPKITVLLLAFCGVLIALFTTLTINLAKRYPKICKFPFRIKEECLPMAVAISCNCSSEIAAYAVGLLMSVVGFLGYGLSKSFFFLPLFPLLCIIWETLVMLKKLWKLKEG